MLRRFSTRLTLLPESWSASAPVAIASLILANILPLLGVLYLEWSLYSVLLLFWLESGVIGLFNILKILIAQGDANRPVKLGETEISSSSIVGRVYRIMSRLGIVLFFCFHYGMFWAVHGLFVQLLFNEASPVFMTSGPLPNGNLQINTASGFNGGSFNGGGFNGGDAAVSGFNGFGVEQFGLGGDVMSAAGFMAISHGISFVSNYLGHGEFRHATPPDLMGGVYGRVMVLHVVILAGGALVMTLEAPVYAVALLVLLKIGVDLRAHLREHRQYADA